MSPLTILWFPRRRLPRPLPERLELLQAPRRPVQQVQAGLEQQALPAKQVKMVQPPAASVTP